MLKGSQERQADYPIDNVFLNRWSPRAMSGEPITHEDLMTLFEAARWAPSSYNAQPWRILYARRDGGHWDRFLGLLVETNRLWAQHAAALLLFISKSTTAQGSPSKTHSYDTGAAWENLALQACSKGYVIHGMQGFDYERARRDLRVPDDFRIEAMAAIGRPGDGDDLPEALRTREKPNDRRPLTQTVCEGAFDFA